MRNYLDNQGNLMFINQVIQIFHDSFTGKSKSSHEMGSALSYDF
jgi:hypothetical protein